MKKILIFLPMLFVTVAAFSQVTKKPEGKQVRTKDDSDTTSTLPKGTTFIKGKVSIDKGYKAEYSSDKKIVYLLAANGNGVSGTFSCKCGGTSSGVCGILIVGSGVVCSGSPCCRMTVSTNIATGLTVRELETAPEKIIWKKLAFPGKSN